MAEQMQFVTNTDYPPPEREIRPRKDHVPPRIDPSDRFDTNILCGGQFQLGQVIVPQPRSLRRRDSPKGNKGGTTPQKGRDDGEESDSSYSSSDSDSDDEEGLPMQEAEHAFWSQRVIKSAIYGNVQSGIILKRCSPPLRTPSGEAVNWVATDELCAIKQYSRGLIQEAPNSAENPYGEISAMQLLSNYQQYHLQQRLDGERELQEEDILRNAQESMGQTNVMMPLRMLYDNSNIYCIMPYVNGGELFDVLDSRQKFSEEEARYWMIQILNGVETLQKAGICHRDMSLENLLTSNDGTALIIDLGMCLRIPYADDDTEEGRLARNNCVDHRQRPRCLIRRDRACGKPYYMSPEIRRNRDAFDGHAVDMWALGPILFLMVAGFPPWEIADPADERFYYFSNGFFGQTITTWNLGLSADLIDILQRMFFVNPRDRMSLEQVRAHPWMDGPTAPPPAAPM